MSSYHYDLVVIGSGPAGQKGAIAAAKLGHRVAIVDRDQMIGGVCLHTGTIPSKTLREAIPYLTGLRHRAFYGRDYQLKHEISVADLVSRVDLVKAREKGSHQPAAPPQLSTSGRPCSPSMAASSSSATASLTTRLSRRLTRRRAERAEQTLRSARRG